MKKIKIEHPEEASVLLNVPFTPDSPAYVSHSLDEVCIPSGEPKTLEKFLTYPEPPTKKVFKPKPCGRDLTSVENMKILHEKERKKQDEIQRKQRAKEEREEKKKAKAEAAKELQRLRKEKTIIKQKEKEQKEKGRRVKSTTGKVYLEAL